MYKNKKNSIVDNTEKARAKNNVNWMDILRLSLKYCPVQAKKILKKINQQDKKISSLLQKLEK